MGSKSVAVLDIRSFEVTVVVGERGVNNTIVFKASKTVPYDGYENGAFYDVGKLGEAIFSAVTAVEKICNERLKKIYVGVPGEFCAVFPKEQFAGFPKKIRIGRKEVDALFAGGREEHEGLRAIHATSMIYVTADNRRVVDPIGLKSTSLSALISYFYCTDYFAETVERIFEGMKIELRFLPTDLAMAAYLIPSETRDEYSLFLDAGYLSSTVCVILGNGVLSQRTFWAGRGQIAALIMEEFGLPFDAAGALLDRVNLYQRGGGKREFSFRDETYEIDTDKLSDLVKQGLDVLCEQAGAFLEECTGRELEYKPLYVTGEGIAEIRGALEHVSRRVSRICELLSPDLPYYNKPSMSSRIALIDMAYEENRANGFLHRIFNGFGG